MRDYQNKKYKTGIIFWFLFFFVLQINLCFADDGPQYIENKNTINSVNILKNDVDNLEGKPKSYYQASHVPKSFNMMDILKKENPDDELRKLLAPLKIFREKDFQKLILKKRRENALFGFLARNPKTRLFIIRLIKDDQALYRLVRVLKQKKLLYIYLAFLIITFVLGYICKQKIKKRMKYVVNQFFADLLMACLFLALRLGFFVYLFYFYLEPTIKIIYSL